MYIRYNDRVEELEGINYYEDIVDRAKSIFAEEINTFAFENGGLSNLDITFKGISYNQNDQP